MKNKKKIIILAIVFCTALVVTAALTFSKYVYNSVWGYYLQSRGFYFSSDSLDTNNKKNSVLTWDGSDLIIDLSNSENDSLVSEYDISYTASCEILGEEKEYLSCNLNNTGKSSYSGVLSSASICMDSKGSKDVSDLIKSQCELGGYTWKIEKTTKQIGFNVELNDETKSIDEVSVQIIVESTAPYKKTLKGLFNLNLKEEETEYNIYYQDYDNYNEVTVTNKINQDACFNLSFDSKKNLYDNSSSGVVETYTAGDKSINKLKIKVNKESSSSFIFYKIKSDEIYSIDDFTLEKIDC